MYSLLDDNRVVPEELLKNNTDVKHSPVKITAAHVLARYSEWPELIRPKAPVDFEEFRNWYEKMNGIVRASIDNDENQEKGLIEETKADLGGYKTNNYNSEKGGRDSGDFDSEEGTGPKLIFLVAGLLFLIVLILWVMKR